MSGSRRAAVLAVGGLLVLAGVSVLVGNALDDGASSSAPSPTRGVLITDAGDARAPFTSLTSGTIRVGDRALDVVVADSLGERVQGLRGRPDAAPYAGMLFVFREDSTGAFTMAGVPAPLEIAFFDSRGRRVDQLRMEPCVGTDATCPVYEASTPYRFTLETAPGGMPDGDLQVASG